ncbi:MAG: GNAT family N-acetyltransferase [Anaerolineaceae bacterium]|nr:GNAT family N-acetyltransferase [Anaerolineaceae bacterium]
MIATIKTQPQQIRKLDTRKDLLPVADLIDLCFGDQMDQDGRDYVQQIRRAARDSRYLRWMPGAGEQISLPLHGYVWEEEDRVVGNLTLIPNYFKGRWYYLIANVAVHPDFRRRGIGRELTETALRHVQEHNAHAAWLHVRDDNFAAQELYRSLGMVERVYRTTWQSGNFPIDPPPQEITVTRRSNKHWALQRQWLQAAYPHEVIWNMPFHPAKFEPGLWAGLLRLFHDDQVQHWSAIYKGELAGVVTWEPSRHSTDLLWLAIHPSLQQETIPGLLAYIQKIFSSDHRFQTNYPAGQAEAAFFQAGFERVNTLIWMEKRFE